MAPFRLKDTLPPNLKSLTLYAGEALEQDQGVGWQLQDVLLGASFPCLEHIILQESFYFALGRSDGGTWPDIIERACIGKGIRFELKRESQLSKGGYGLRY
jgi:hypothetical protein